jgi:hypothetical protein
LFWAIPNRFTTGETSQVKQFTGFSAFVIALLFASGLVSAQPQTITVSSNSCRGPGSLDEAVTTANANPGSTIKIPSAVTVSLSSCRGSVMEPAYTLIENTIIEGDYTPLPNGDPDFSGPTAISGGQRSITPDGRDNQECPSPLDTIIRQSPGLFAIGGNTTDNTGLTVTVRNVRLEDLPWLFTVRTKAGLVVEDAFFNEIRNKNFPCEESMIDLRDGASLTITNSVINEPYMKPPEPVPGHVFPNGLILSGGLNTIQLERVKWLGSGGNNVMFTSAGSTVNIVSSWFDDVGGFRNSGGTWHMVNSVWSAKGTIDFFSPFTTFNTGAITVIEASTLRSEGAGCPACIATGHPLQAFWGGRVELKSTVVGGSNFSSLSSGAVLGVASGGSSTADDTTWIQPSFFQDAAELRTITAQPNLLTDPPGIKTTSSGIDSILDKSQPLVPSVLLDIVDNTATPLLNPINGQPITLDVFGSPRLDGDRRDAGAVQIGSFNNPSFTITTQISSRGDGQVALSWTRPQDPPGSTVAGYKVEYRESGTTSWSSVDISGAGSLQGTVSGLTNGTLYEFQVVPYNASNVDGPPSNTVSATPIGLPGAPTVTPVAQPGAVTLNWTEPTANGSPLTDYTVLYRESSQSNWSIWPYSAFPTRNVTVSGLTNGVKYDFAVEGINGAGTGPRGIGSETPREILFLSYADVTGYVSFPLTVYPTYANVYGTPTYSVTAGSVPPGMAFDSSTGIFSGIPAGSAASYQITVELKDSAQTTTPTYATFTITIDGQTEAKLSANYDNYTGPAGTALGSPLQPHVTGIKGASLTFSLSGDPLPTGLTLDSTTGEISGTPTTATGRVYSFNMEISDGVGTVNEPFNIEITPTLLYAPVVGEAGDPLSVSPTVSPSAQPGTFLLASGSTLPAGLTLDPSSGSITGTPAQPSNTAVTVEYTTGQQTVTNQFALRVNGYQPSLTYPPFAGVPGNSVSLSPSITGTKGTLAFNSSTALPDGLTLDPNTGVITGVLGPITGSTAIQITVTDQYQQRAVANAVFTISSSQGPAAVPVPALNVFGLALLSLLMIAAALRRLVE